MCIKMMYNNHIYFKMYSNIKWQLSAMQNFNYFCTNLIHAIFQPKKPRPLQEMANVVLQRKNTGERRLSCNARMKEKENGAH